MFSFIRAHLAWKLFLSFLIVILVGVVVLATTTSLSIPAAFDQYLAGMSLRSSEYFHCYSAKRMLY